MTDPRIPTMRYAAYCEQVTGPNGAAIPVTWIMVEDQDGIPVKVTRLQDFLAQGPNLVSPFRSTARTLAHFFCPMLNYCIFEHKDEFGIVSPLEITKPMMEQYFREYASSPAANGQLRMPETVQHCIEVNAFTMAQLVSRFGEEMKLTREDLLVPRMKYVPSRGIVTTDIPNFDISGGKARTGLLRDIRTDAFELLLGLAFVHTPDIAFGICLQAFAGLRPGEVCNARQDSSVYGPFITYTMDGCGRKIPILDLSKEYVLRSDNRCVGGIKRERMQKVYPDFVPAFDMAYERHRNYLSTIQFEADYAPMFVNSYGMAMTYADYENRFNELVMSAFVPELLRQPQPLADFGVMVKERGLEPHIGRHVFTMQLVERRLTPEQIKTWRGDKSIESAMTYWADKGELKSNAQNVGTDFTKAVMEYGGRLNE